MEESLNGAVVVGQSEELKALTEVKVSYDAGWKGMVRR